jgi:ATP-dependent Clp protease ATP-binding subunit ClpA
MKQPITVKKLGIFLSALFLFCGSTATAKDQTKFYIQEELFQFDATSDENQDAEELIEDLTPPEEIVLSPEIYHIFKSYDPEKHLLTLQDLSVWKVNKYDDSKPNSWEQGDRLSLQYHPKKVQYIEIKNIDKESSSLATSIKMPALEQKLSIIEIDGNTLSLSNGATFTIASNVSALKQWNLYDFAFFFHGPDGEYSILNMSNKQIIDHWKLESISDQPTSKKASKLLALEDKLNERVIGQEEAASCVASAMINNAIGLNNPDAPVGVFLFIGPSGVGKTELAKVLSEEYYLNKDRMIRLDMSQYSASHSITRLIGSPPGYIGSEEGGQLTNPLMAQPHSLVLLDEIEKAAPEVLKAFLPIFDEGYIVSAKDEKVNCKDAIFILTSNLHANEISKLFHRGETAEDVIDYLEPKLMQALSPELYNRTSPLAFRPLTPESMDRLVDLGLKPVISRLKEKKNINLVIDSTVKEYLMEYGYHKALGARPLKKLIDKKVVSFVAYSIVKEQIPEGCTMELSYESRTNSWHINWE